MQVPRKPKLEPVVYCVPEIAALLDINLPRAYELVKNKNFPAIKIGKRIVVPKAGFERWLEQAVLAQGKEGNDAA